MNGTDVSNAAAGGMVAGMMFIWLIVCAALYVYFALALSTIAKKTNTENAWMAWVPIANVILMLNVAKKPIWWIILFLVPFVNIIIIIMLWMGIAEARNKPAWMGVLMIVPVANLIVPALLAWTD